MRNSIEIQFGDGSIYVLRSHYIGTLNELSRKLMKAKVPVEGGDVANLIFGIGVYRNEKLSKSYGSFDPEKL